MEQFENPWVIRGTREVEFELYCHKEHCTSFNLPQIIPGVYETDTGWAEPDWEECRDCGEILADEPMREI